MPRQQKITVGEMRASDRPAENYLGCALLINATVERRTQRQRCLTTSFKTLLHLGHSRAFMA